jgi:hypothetical protein
VRWRVSDDPVRGWRPVVGERVVLVRTGQTATVVQLAPTEWGLLCDLDIDPDPAARLPGGRRVHASTELRQAGEG